VALLAAPLVSGCPGEAPQDPAGAAGAKDAEPPGAEPAAREQGSLSPNARPDIHRMLVEDRAREPHPADGSGRARLLAATPLGADRLVAGGRARFELVYEAGPLGVAEGGAVYLQSSPFWGWDTPQSAVPGAPGYTQVRTDAPGVELVPRTADRNLLEIRIAGRALTEGERVEITFGAGESGARVDRFAEREAALWIAVDGDGDGSRRTLPDPPTVDVAPGPPARLGVWLPGTARPGDELAVGIALLDAVGNAVPDAAARVRFEVSGPASPPAPVELGGDAGGHERPTLAVDGTGVLRLRARARLPGRDQPLEAESNPVLVREGAPRLLWADLHGHSQLSDGTGTPEDYFRYARDTAHLDVAALTDHDHWGLRFLDDRPELWQRIRTTVERFHEPGRFVTIPGYEWTSWLHGHRHVLYFDGDGPVLSSLDPETQTPAGLWEALEGRDALTFAHHSAGAPVATDWSFRPPPEVEPVTEVASVHGSSEAPDAPGVIGEPVRGNFVRDVLDRGYALGFVGSGDSHDGHPGLAHLASPHGGLAGIFAGARTREAVLEALRARRTLATNGPRIALLASLDGRPMGATVPAPDDPDAEHRLRLEIAAPAPLERVDLVRSGELLAPLDAGGRRELEVELALPRLEPGEYLYLRAVQRDGGAAWSSPFFAEPAAGAPERQVPGSSSLKTRTALSRRNFGHTSSRNGTSGSSRKMRSSERPIGK